VGYRAGCFRIQAAIDIPGPLWRLAAAVAIRGDRTDAIAWYARAVAAGRRELEWDRFDPLLSSLRNDPRFLELSIRTVSPPIIARRNRSCGGWPRRCG